MATLAITTEHDVQGIGYDLNGNIQALARFGADDGTVPAFGQWDALAYTYNGNKLVKVEDNGPLGPHKDLGFKDGTNSGNDYLYDDNGNMKTDSNKGIVNIKYNHLNLPVTVDFSGNKNNIKEINYIYDATGVKLAKILKDGSTISTQYAGGFIYNDAADGQMALQFFSHPEGYVEPVSEGQRVKGFEIGVPGATYSSYKYVFQYKDHLGNIRLSYSDADLNGSIDPNTEIIEESNYYPFGLRHKGYNNVVNDTHHPYTFNGKEEQEELGLNWLDFSARNYDAALGRWMNIDPMAEDMRRYSPYVFAFDNPIYYIDPDGMMPLGMGGMDDEKNFDFESSRYITSTVVNNEGKIIDYKDDGDDNIYLNERSAENIIGRERDGVTYSEGNYLEADDLNEDALSKLPDSFHLSLGVVEPILNYFWGGEILGGGGLIRVSSWINKLRLLKFGSRIKASNVKQLKALIKKLSKPGSELSPKELEKLERLVEKFGGKIRRDLNPIKGKIKKPHVQVKGLGKSIESRHIWLK